MNFQKVAAEEIKTLGNDKQAIYYMYNNNLKIRFVQEFTLIQNVFLLNLLSVNWEAERIEIIEVQME